MILLRTRRVWRTPTPDTARVGTVHGYSGQPGWTGDDAAVALYIARARPGDRLAFL